MKFNLTTLSYIVIFLCLFFSIKGNAQVSKTISNVLIENENPFENEPLQIKLALLNSSSIESINIFYNNFENIEYKSIEMEIYGEIANVIIPSNDVLSPFLEYYFEIKLTNGEREIYPEGAPINANPFQIRINTKTKNNNEIIVLSPEPNSQINSDDFFVSISLLKVSDRINKSNTKIFLDNNDITSMSLIADDLILYNPSNYNQKINSGNHLLKIELYDSSKNIYQSKSISFFILQQNVSLNTNEIYNSNQKSAIKYNFNIKSENRNENIRDNNNWYNNLNLNFNSEYSNWQIIGNAYITSEEKKYLQPNNRYSIIIQNDWLKLNFGDNYPQYPNLILNGKRVRGFSGNISVGIFNLSTSLGQITRDIEGNILQMYNSYNVPIGSDIIPIDSTKNGFPFAKVNFGTFKRNITVIRPSIGNGKIFQFSLTYLHSKDDKESINFGNQPKENLVIGTDFSLSLDNKKIQLTGQGAFSLVNNDITTGTLSDEMIDSVFGSSGTLNADPETIKDIKNILGNFITVNQFISPINPEKLPTLAAEANLSLNYFNNFFKSSYIYRGNDFKSFGQEFIRTDIAGFNFMDRIRLIQNQLFISFSYENLKDNLQNTKISTTTFQTINTSISYYPRKDFPSIIIGYSRYDNQNEINVNDTNYGMYAIDDITNRYSAQISYNFFWHFKQQASINFNLSNRNDKSLSDYDVDNFSIYISDNLSLNENLSSFFNFGINQSTIKNEEFDYVSILLGGKYKLMENKLELSGSISPTFGNFERRVLEISANYFLIKNLSFNFQFRFLSYPYLSDDTIFALTTRYNFY